MIGRGLWIGVLLAALPACALLEPDRTAAERTLPEALELERVSLQALQRTASLPGSYNVHVFVVGVNECDPDARCVIPDGILVAETRTPDLPEDGLHLAVIQPRQFDRYQPYVLSIEAEPAGWRHPETGEEVRSFRLLGYSPNAAP